MTHDVLPAHIDDDFAQETKQWYEGSDDCVHTSNSDKECGTFGQRLRDMAQPFFVTDAVIDITEWPVVNDAARHTLLAASTTHTAQLIPAYNVHGQLIMPHDYFNAMRNSWVKLRFSINAYPSTVDGGRVLAADIDWVSATIAPCFGLMADLTPDSSRRAQFRHLM